MLKMAKFTLPKKWWHMVAAVFVFWFAVAPVKFALAKGEEEASQTVKPLLERISGIGENLTVAVRNGYTTVSMNGWRYVFGPPTRQATGDTSGPVWVYDNQNRLVDRATLTRVATLDDNRLDFEAVITHGQVDGASAEVVGSMIGVPNDPNRAVTTVQINGQSSVATVNLDTITVQDGLHMEPFEMFLAGVVIVLVVLFVALTCVLLGWWGCD